MTTRQIPISNTWYLNKTGKLLKVRLIGYGRNGIESVLLEYLDGSRQFISIQAWSALDLTIHCLPALPAPKLETDLLS